MRKTLTPLLLMMTISSASANYETTKWHVAGFMGGAVHGFFGVLCAEEDIDATFHIPVCLVHLGIFACRKK